MKILQLCHKPPFPVRDGGCLAINQISQGLLAQNNELHILTIATPKHPFLPKEYPKGYLKKTNLKSVYVDTRLNVVDAFSNLITQDAYHVSRFFSPDVDRSITELLAKEEFDIILLESIFVAPYIGSIRRLSKGRIVLRSHNLEFSIWHRLAKSHKSGLKKTYLKILARQLKNYEVELLNQIDGLVAINVDEQKHYRRLGFKGPACTIPFGIEPDQYLPEKENFNANSVFHLGSMDWKPNEEGIEWMLEKVWPLVCKKNKDVKLYLAGRQMPEWLKILNLPQVEIVGEVDDAKDFINAHHIMIIPLLSGGGMRVKMIEALALAKPIVSTQLGAKGVTVQHEESAMIATAPRDFAESILQLLNDPEKAEGMGLSGRALVQEFYDNTKLASSLQKFLQKLNG